MATYFHGPPPPEIQSDGLQTLYLMNPNFMGCSSDAPTTQNMLLMNSGGLHYWTPTAAASALNQQGLSLSLSQPPPYMTHRPPPPENDVISQAASPPGALVGSKYLKAARELLEEVVSVISSSVKEEKGRAKSDFRTNGESEGGSGGGGGGDGGGGVEISMVERQELQMKKAKLVRMLDEVEQRYRQYHHQMQIITSVFEATAGTGSAKTYTSLALRTISRQFRCLRDAISGQIRATGRRLGEEEVAGEGGSRLRFVDHHLRQQRALQRLGMVQHNNTWRPQRGLPEQAVSVLRAWLFEHFLHPYPKDSDKHMLAKQTGLTRSQVSNWFINARVRLWKPMVEEMYIEEIKQEPNTTIDGEATAKDDSASRSSTTAQSDPPPTSITDPIRYEETMEPFKPKKARIEYLRQAPSPPPPPFGAYFGAAEQMRFSNNGVSLTLGLHENNQSMAASMQQVSDAYEGLSMQSRERFSAHHQLLPDFVA